MSEIRRVEERDLHRPDAAYPEPGRPTGRVLEGFRFELRTSPGGRIGHVHRTAEDSQGHVVPAMSREDHPA